LLGYLLVKGSFVHQISMHTLVNINQSENGEDRAVMNMGYKPSERKQTLTVDNGMRLREVRWGKCVTSTKVAVVGRAAS